MHVMVFLKKNIKYSVIIQSEHNQFIVYFSNAKNKEIKAVFAYSNDD